MFTMQDSYPAKVQLYGRCHVMGDGIEWSVMIDGSESPLEHAKEIYKQVVEPVKKCTAEYGLSALGFFHSKTCSIDDASEEFNKIKGTTLAGARTKGCFSLRMTNDYNESLTLLRNAYNKYEGKNDACF